MDKKIDLQEVTAILAAKGNLSSDVAERFVQFFFDVIEEGLETDKFVKIRGWGTFKIIAVSERESINVNTGARIQIGSHSKVTFTPDNALKESVNKPFSQFQTVVINDGTDLSLLESVDTWEYGNEEENYETASTEDSPSVAQEKGQEGNTGNQADNVAPDTPAVQSAVPQKTDETAEAHATAIEPEDMAEIAPPIPPLVTDGIVQQETDTKREAAVNENLKAPPVCPTKTQEISPQERQDQECSPSSPINSTVNGPAVQYIIQEVVRPQHLNVWKIVAQVLVCILLMTLSYCAGYHQILCP